MLAAAPRRHRKFRTVVVTLRALRTMSLASLVDLLYVTLRMVHFAVRTEQDPLGEVYAQVNVGSLEHVMQGNKNSSKLKMGQTWGVKWTWEGPKEKSNEEPLLKSGKCAATTTSTTLYDEKSKEAVWETYSQADITCINI
ncbi:uncharacterized protein LOC142581639 isoform X2 [Dermacentor variabilis]|uniref:uncharacterized protein LOC142581639 isoform X2 n=1 Tax=Dermacentor variabilis TaxID=34621 RepID=UPI003F5B737D